MVSEGLNLVGEVVNIITGNIFATKITNKLILLNSSCSCSPQGSCSCYDEQQDCC